MTVSSGDPTLTTAVTVGSVVINGSGQWDLAGPGGSATLTGTLGNSNVLALDFFGNQGGSNLTVGGTLTNTSGGTVQVGTSGGSLSATSTLSAAALSNSGTIDRFGNTTNPANQANLTVTGPASNSGTVNILSAGNLTVTGGGNSYAQTAGTTNILAGGMLGAPNINVTGGTLQGNGTVAGNLNVSLAGTVEGDVPNTNTPATLTVNGNYNQTGGTLAALLQGTGAGQVSTINVGTGGVNLSGGVLQTNFTAGLIPAAGQTFNNVMTYAPGSLNGLFAALQNGSGSLSSNPTYLNLGGGLTLGVNYNNSAGNVQLQVVNTPATTVENWNGGTGNWSTGSGWSSGAAPTFYSDVGIGLTASGNVTLNQDGTVNSLAIHNGMQGGTLTAASLTNAGTTSGFGTIAPAIANTGLVQASGGTLTAQNGVQGTTGNITVTPAATLDLSQSTTGSSAATLAVNGNLNLGAQNLTVATAYTNANFGTGNSFDKSANVTGAGQILAAGNVAQAVSGGQVTNGTGATPTLALGNVHVGSSTSTSYAIANTGSSGPS